MRESRIFMYYQEYKVKLQLYANIHIILDSLSILNAYIRIIPHTATGYLYLQKNKMQILIVYMRFFWRIFIIAIL